MIGKIWAVRRRRKYYKSYVYLQLIIIKRAGALSSYNICVRTVIYNRRGACTVYSVVLPVPVVKGEHHHHRYPEGERGGDDGVGLVHNQPAHVQHRFK